MPGPTRHMQKVPFYKHYSALTAPLFVSIFAVIGVTLLLTTHAATPVANTIEPESGSLTGNVSTAADSNASAGSYVNFFAPVAACPSGQVGTPPNCSPAGTVNIPNPGTWTNVTGNLAGMASECGNMTGIWAQPNTSSVIGGVAQKGLWISSGNGTWAHQGSGAGSDTITNRPNTISFDPAHPNTWYEAGIYNGGGVYKTTDGGTTWKQLGNISHVDFVSVDYTDVNRQTLVAGHHEGGQQVWLSKDGGTTWTNIGANLPGGTGFSSSPVVINTTTYVIDTSQSWGGGTPGIYRTTNSGASWTLVSSVNTLPAAPLVTSSGAIYYQVGSFSSDHLIKSTDNGSTWKEVGSGLGSVSPIELPDGRLASISGNKLAYSSDGGVTWTTFGATLPYTPNTIAYSSGSGAFYVNHWDCGNAVLSDAVERLH